MVEDRFLIVKEGSHSEMETLISIIICTRNRADLLRRALNSVLEQNSAEGGHEIIIVDNGSTDCTPQVVSEFLNNSGVRYLYEATTGLCVARNTGWRNAKGKYVAYFDDDAIASPGWLNAIQQGFAEHPDAIGILGGPVRPIWEIPRPAWLSDALVCSLTAIDWGDRDKLISDIAQEWLVGANMAVPKQLLEAIGGFHPWLDRVGNNLLSSGDVYLQTQIMRRGLKCYYSASMIIGHLVPAARLDQSWFTRRYFWQGVSDAVIEIIDDKPSIGRRLRRVAQRMAKLVKTDGGISVLFTKTDHPDRFAAKCFSLIDVGYVAGLLGAARH